MKSVNYKSMEVLCFKLYSSKFVNHCGILYHGSETSGCKDTAEALNSSFFVLSLDMVYLVLVDVFNMLSHITNATENFKICCSNYILYFKLFKLIIVNIIFSIS